MIHRRPRSRKKQVWILTVLGVMLVLFITSLVYARRARDLRERAVAVARQEQEARELAQTQALDKARRELPADAGIAPDWQPQDLWTSLPGCRRLVQAYADAYLQESSNYVDRAFQIAQNQVENALEGGDQSPFVQEVDQRQHTREAILASLGTYLSTAPPIVEFEKALRFGLVVPQDDVHSLRDFSTFLALRALSEAEQARIEAAVQSLFNAFDTLRVIENTAHSRYLLNYRPCCIVFNKLVDAAWRSTPLTLEDRERLLKALACDGSLDRISENLHADLREFYAPSPERARRDDTANSLVQAGELIFQKTVACAGMPRCTQELDRLLHSPPYKVAPQILALWNSVPQFAGATQSYLGECLRSYANEWRRTITPDIARLVFALKDYKREHGQYPASLAEAGQALPASPIDPIGGLPMVYASDGKGFAITFPNCPAFDEFHTDMPEPTSWNFKE